MPSLQQHLTNSSAHRGLPPIVGLCGQSHWLSPHCTFLPVRAAQVTATPCLQDEFDQIGGTFSLTEKIFSQTVVSFADFFGIVSKVHTVRSCAHVPVVFILPYSYLHTLGWKRVYSLLTGDTFE